MADAAFGENYVKDLRDAMKNSKGLATSATSSCTRRTARRTVSN